MKNYNRTSYINITKTTNPSAFCKIYDLLCMWQVPEGMEDFNPSLNSIKVSKNITIFKVFTNTDTSSRTATFQLYKIIFTLCYHNDEDIKSLCPLNKDINSIEIAAIMVVLFVCQPTSLESFLSSSTFIHLFMFGYYSVCLSPSEGKANEIYQ